jgi:energy-coupling factor transporter transmembrane protein EcfT
MIDAMPAGRAGISSRVGETGTLVAFAATVALAALAQGWRAAEVLGLAILLALLLSRRAIARTVGSRSLAVMAILSLGLGGILGREHDLTVGWVSLSSEGLQTGVQMLARALAIMIAVQTLTARISLSTVASVFERIGFKGLGFALGVAVNALPLVQQTFDDVLMALRLRGGLRGRRWLRGLRLLLLTTIVNSAHHAEDIVAAAEARGFRVDQSHPSPMVWKRGDSALAIAILISAIGILWL